MATTKRVQRFLYLVGFVCTFLILASCSYQAALRQLSPEEQAAFRVYRKIMTPAQAHTYVAKETATERTAYLKSTGLLQRLQALDPQDRASILAGYIRTGMRADALRLLWGEPYYAQGYTGHYEYWLYLGSSFLLAEYGNQHGDAGNMVQVYLLNGQVTWWLDFVPDTSNDPGDDSGCLGC